VFKSETCARRVLRWGMLVSKPVYGTIVNYRIGIRTQMPKWCLIQIIGENTVSKVGQLVGPKMILKLGKNSLIGRIVCLHGKKSVVKVKFQKACLDEH
jgi:ribosomal protein L35AE/L33A